MTARDRECRRRRSVAIILLAVPLMAGCVTVKPGPGATTPPASAAAPTSGASPTRVTSYTVRSNDTLTRIARRFGLTLGQLLTANPDITDPNLLRVGQVLVIPPPDAPDNGPSSAGITDPHDDLADPDGAPAEATAYGDITGLGARLDGNQLRVQVGLVNRPPRAVDPFNEVIAYTVVIDVDGDAQPDYRFGYRNDLEGQDGFAASFEDIGTGEMRLGRDFPGDLTVTEASVTWTVPRRTVGDGRSYQLAAKVERSFFPGGRTDPEVEATVDYAPNQQWPMLNPRWLQVGGP